jgi:hypothetical protein
MSRLALQLPNFLVHVNLLARLDRRRGRHEVSILIAAGTDVGRLVGYFG